ncbi:sigma 54-interacting transcriptional regulator [Metabacillus herbersteinensis]|uniref:Sigma 54-interacting transcriptional regulator n=1 Tax=Metabacillus herbersteinensis TaxID=283816 RepID=A0ABV6GK63_9BACI
MTPRPYFIQSGKTLREAADLMVLQQIESLPIVDEYDHPINVITMTKIVSSMVKGETIDSIISNRKNRNFVSINLDDSVLDIYKLPYGSFPVVDHDGKLVGILTRRDILDCFSKYTSKLEREEYSLDVLREILESAYEGIAVVDEHGILREFNDAYSRFTGIPQSEAIGKHVTEIIENTKLHETVETGVPQRGVVQKIQGQDMVVHRIPIWKDQQIVGAIGMLIFEGVTELYRIFERINETTRQNHGETIKNPMKSSEETTGAFDRIIGDSHELDSIKRLARRSARTSATVLITGESGTGKELFAKGTHELSPFSEGPFITVNCGAIPENLFESELFGYEEGSFTGARKGGKPGKFELANNGTIFLDEIGEMPLMMQTKLLRLLQEKEAERVGGVKKYQVNVRIIAATNRPLEEMVEKKEFREDLFYRLNIIRLHIPPLRQRSSDIPILLSTYMNKICTEYATPEKKFTHEAYTALLHYHWPGNVREIINTIERLVTLVGGKNIYKEDLPLSITNKSKKTELLEELPIDKLKNNDLIHQARYEGEIREKELIRSVLKQVHGNKSKAASMLGIHRTTLYQKLKRFQIT